MTVLVTGASGFVGTGLCKELSQRGMPFFVLKRGDSLPLGIQFTAVLHLAGRAHVTKESAVDPISDYRAANVDATLRLASESAAAGIRRFIFLSSVKVNGESTAQGKSFGADDVPAPEDAYGISKMEAEAQLRILAADTGMEVTIIRSPLVYGPGVKANFASLMRAVCRGWPLPLGAVHNQRSLVGLDNLIDFILTCASHPKAANQTFLVSDGHDLSTSELVRKLAYASGVSPRLLPVPVRLLILLGSLIGREKPMQRLCGNLQVDISKARNLLGWEPPFSVEEGLRRAVRR